MTSSHLSKSRYLVKCSWHNGTTPTVAESVFYVIRQLGYGQAGVCCFAKNEASNWERLYGDLGLAFLKAYEHPRVFLVMPFVLESSLQL